MGLLTCYASVKLLERSEGGVLGLLWLLLALWAVWLFCCGLGEQITSQSPCNRIMQAFSDTNFLYTNRECVYVQARCCC